MTQWDAFGHAGALFDADGDGTPERVYDNGWRAGVDVVGPDRPDRAGIGSLGDLDGIADGAASTSDAGPADVSHMARHGVQGRAVLVDLAARFGTARTVVGFAARFGTARTVVGFPSSRRCSKPTTSSSNPVTCWYSTLASPARW